MKDKPLILLVDDEPVNLKLLEANLIPQGYSILNAADGSQALKIIETNNVDLILLDVMMPGMDGFEVTRKIRANTKTKLLPVVLVTSLKDISDRIKGIEAGCDDFISKPFDRGELIARTKSLLNIKFLRDELEENYLKLKSLEELKQGLAHMVVHDLNNPLTIVMLKAEILKDKVKDKLSEQDLSDLEAILASGQDLQRMIGNILDINRMEEGRLKLIQEEFSLEEVSFKIVEQLKPYAACENKTLTIEVNKGLPNAFADKELIRRVIGNLINNGLKFVRMSGEVNLSISYSDNTFVIKVRDNGRGIPQEYLEKIFDKFFQVENKDVRGGRGLGLTFCKMVIDAHQGKIWVESQIGQGSTFIFTLPIKPKNI